MADWTSEELAGLRFVPAQREPRARRAGDGGFRPLRAVASRPGLSALAGMAALAVTGLLFWRLPHWTGGGDELAADRPVLEAPAWSPILKAAPSFTLDTPLFPRDQASHEARRHNPGGGREDIFVFGTPGGRQGFARVVAYRIGSEAHAPGTLFLELARRAAEAGYAVARSAFPAPLASRFGLLELADMTLSGADGEHRCLAWRMVADEQDLRVTGWLCGADGKAIDRQTLACFAERLELPASQTDKALRAFFSAAERGRTPGCPAPRPAVAGRRPA
jgi:hypothetical protein